jgi:hypothetical protein
MKDSAARDFWHAFGTEAATLARTIAAGNMREAFQRIESLLREHGFDFCFELTEEGGEAVLVLTPEGDHEQAGRIDRLLEATRGVPGWRIYGRRQRKPLKDAFAFVRTIYGLDVSDATFDIRDTPKGYEVTMRSKAVKGLTGSEARGLVATFLDHAVGEDVVMERVAVLHADDGLGHLSPASLVASLVGH